MKASNSLRAASRLGIVCAMLLAVVGKVSEAQNATSAASTKALQPPPLPILSPTALTGDPGDGRVYLRWNLQLEDERVIGWRVVQLDPKRGVITTETLTEPQFVVKGLENGVRYTFSVEGVLKNGGTTPQSNTATVTPNAVGEAKVSPLREKTTLAVGPHENIAVGRNAAKVVFPDGQELVYDNYRPIDWKTRNREHLIYPKRFGNGLDIGQFDSRGLAVILPPEPAGPNQEPPPPSLENIQRGTPHPHITNPMTLPMDREHHDASSRWFTPQVDGNRVTFSYWQPMVAMGYRAWNYMLVWETWWPIERDRHGTKYHGLARLVEVQMPEAWKDGYQVMVNNGFGPRGGSREGVVSYSSGFRRPTHEVVDFSGERNRQVFFQSPKPPRRGGQYHPTQDCLQSSPLIFYDWPTGSLTIGARSLYYHCANNSASYPEQGADGAWPNLAWDLAIAGKRTAVETVEYLYTSEMSQPLPQRYLNARLEALTDVSRRMGLQDTLAALAVTGTLGEVQRDGGPVSHAEKWVAKLKVSGIDGYHIFHDFWHAVPVTVDDAYRLDETHDCNPSLKAMCDKFHAAGIKVGFWYRPEFVKTSILNALSATIPTAETYYGYKECDYPDVVSLLKQRGIPLFRENPSWVRVQRDGSWPVNTPYQWVPMNLASGWWDRVMWPTLWMSKKLGFDWVLFDGGFAGASGVYYPALGEGKTGRAVACQPYWWRMWRSLHRLGLQQFGECTAGWKGGFVNLTGPGDEYYIWMYQASAIWGNEELAGPAQLHKLYQLYNGSGGGRIQKPEAGAVCRYAQRFYKTHKAPDWIEFTGLKQGEPREVTYKVAESPVAGSATRISEAGAIKETVRPWDWGDVVWHYDDGTQAVYPAYEKIEWSKE